jgi:hypothetical protein
MKPLRILVVAILDFAAFIAVIFGVFFPLEGTSRIFACILSFALVALAFNLSEWLADRLLKLLPHDNP